MLFFGPTRPDIKAIKLLMKMETQHLLETNMPTLKSEADAEVLDRPRFLTIFVIGRWAASLSRAFVFRTIIEIALYFK
jgi:hypothetical protein